MFKILCLVVLLLTSQSVHAQRLKRPYTDTETKEIVTATNWNKVARGKGTLHVRIRRVADRVEFDHRGGGGKEKKVGNRHYVQFILDDNSTLDLEMASQQVLFANTMEGKQNIALDDFYSPTHPFTEEQIKTLRNHSVKGINISLFGTKYSYDVIEKQKDVLKECFALVM